MAKAVLFDLDGTLVRSDLFSLPAYRRARREFGLPDAPDEVVKQEIGGTREENWALVMPERPLAEYTRYVERIIELIWTEYIDCVAAYDGMLEALTALRAHGYQTVLCSNGSRSYYMKILEKAGLLGQLDYLAERVQGADKVGLVASVLDKLSPEKAVMVGDRRHDAQAARGNAIAFIGCRYGLFPEEIAVQNPDAVIDSPAQLLETVDILLKKSC